MKAAFFVVVAGLCCIGCARPSFDPAAEAAKLLKRDAEWATAAGGTDVDRIVSYWTDDAMIVPPGQPVVEGKAAIREFVARMQKIPGFRIHWASEKPQFSPDGNMAYMRGVNETTMQGPDGKPTTVRGRGFTVWRRDADGEWRCVVDIWNDPPAGRP